MPRPRKTTTWTMRPRETLTDSQHKRLLQVPLARPAISRTCDLARPFADPTAGLTLPWSSGPVEGHVNRIKMLKRQMYGQASLPLLRKRVLLA
ncbi:hypothetical protein ACIQVL_51490 [Streptomyces sp. NPDC090499]|uniref:hypothetical protein n=1 Tax=Streptomyces sp. NPDC090499 TaxID=3365965 RepID=UPI003811E960